LDWELSRSNPGARYLRRLGAYGAFYFIRSSKAKGKAILLASKQTA